MKTSKIIFISFFGVIALFLLSLLIQVKPSRQEFNIPDNIDRKALPLSGFTNLVIKGGSNVSLYYGKNDSIKYGQNKGAIPKVPSYRLLGDTLFIEGPASSDFYYIDIYAANVNNVTIENSSIDFHNIHFSSLSVIGQNSEINFAENANVDTLSLNLKKMEFHYYNSNIKDLNLLFSHVQGDFSIDQIGKLNADLRDSSELNTGKFLKSEIHTDATSRYYSR